MFRRKWFSDIHYWAKIKYSTPQPVAQKRDFDIGLRARPDGNIRTRERAGLQAWRNTPSLMVGELKNDDTFIILDVREQ